MSELDVSRLGQRISFLKRYENLIAPAVFAILTLIVFNTALIDASKVVASALASDLPLQFLPWRKFGFDELRHGNLPLWNPYIFGGAPYFGGFQSALLYPPNWLHLFLPVGLAINWINALHVFAAGYFTNLWCRHRHLSVVASILAGVMFMFSGAYFSRVYAGHLPHIAVMVWVPLLFLSIDLLIKGVIARGTLLGICVMAMLLLAGHPQYVHYTGMAAAIYVAINLFRFKNIPRGIAGCAMIVVGGMALAAVQLLAGLDAASESVRSGGTSYQFASQFSFPPENVLTALSPNVFGNLPIHGDVTYPENYFGRVYLWEVSLYFSVTGLVLAIFGAISGPLRSTRNAMMMVVICFVLALGAHTPLHRLLYDFLPGFSMFRGAAKFNFLVVLFFAQLAAYGFDALLRARKTPVSLLVIVGLTLFVAIGLSAAIGFSSTAGLNGLWGRAAFNIFELAIKAEDQMFTPALYRGNDKFFIDAGQIASNELAGSAYALGGIIAIVILCRIKFAFAYLLVPLAIVELSIYAFSLRATTESQPKVPQGWREVIAVRPENARILGVENENLGMWMGYSDAWGYDPNVMKRYAEMMMFAQGFHPKDAKQYIPFGRTHYNIFPLLRISAVLFDDPSDPIRNTPKPMELAQLIPQAKVLTDRDKILWELQPNSFEPRNLVILERDPNMTLTNKSVVKGTVNVVRQSTDQLELKVDTADNAILLITNSYSRSWRARAVGQSPQSHYDLMPADWALQAIPLVAGQHHLIVEYRPTLFVIGKWISIVSLMAYAGAIIWIVRRNRASVPRLQSDQPR